MEIKTIWGLLRVACAASFFCSAAAWPLALDPNKPIADFIHDRWSVDQGLPHSTIRGIAQTKDGYLWIATHEGVARFDGRSFTVFNRSNTPALLSNGVTALFASRDGSLWLGLRDGGVVRHRKGVFEAIKPIGGIPSGTIEYIDEGKNGAMWIASNSGGVARIIDNQSRLFTAKTGLPSNAVSALHADNNGDIWVGTYEGLALIRGEELIRQPTGEKLDQFGVNSIISAANGRIVFATNGGGLFIRDDGKWTQLTTRDGLVSDAVIRVLNDSDGSLWLGTLEGLQRKVGNKFELYTTAKGLSNNYVHQLLQDMDGSLWVGTDNGLDRLRDGSISMWGKQRGISEEFTRVVLEDRAAANTWVGTTDGLYRLNANGSRRFDRADGLLSAAILSVEEGRDGTIWVGTNAGGLHRLRGERFENVGGEFGVPAVSIRAIKSARDGTLWLGTNVGVFHLNKSTVVGKFTAEDGLPNGQVYALHEDKDAVMWVGTRDGAVVIVDSGVEKRAGLEKLQRIVFAIDSDQRGRLWFATSDGIVLLNDGKSHKFTAPQGIPARAYFTLVNDEQGSFWLCSNEGLLKVKLSELEEVANGKRATVSASAFGRADGMATKQCNGGLQPAGWRTKEGKLLFPTAEGVVVVTPAATERVVRRPPSVLIESISVDGESVPIGQAIVLGSRQRRVEFSYVGLSFIEPEKVRYRYRLNGFDKDWVEAGTVQRASYTNLDPGEYQFEVLASNGDGVWSAAGPSIPVSREGAFFRSLWFQLLMVAALLGTALLAYRARAIRLLRNRAKLERQVKERTDELALEKKKLQALNEEKSRLLVQVHEQSEAYKRLATEDSLTGLANRRELDRMLTLELQRANRSKQSLVVVLADLDHFKQVNDRFSHAIGDEVLRRIGRLFRENCRANDLAARYGGEEFVLLLPGTDVNEASTLCERLRRTIEKHPWGEVAPGLAVTMSFGVAPCGALTDPNRLLDLADEKLYQAKLNGRNRVVT